MNTVEQDNEVEKTRRLTALRQQARTFRELFTTPLGKSVLEILETKFGHGIAMNILDNNGRTDELQTWRRQGSNDVINYIHIQIAEKEHVNPSSGST
jgi:hypothetical protein